MAFSGAALAAFVGVALLASTCTSSRCFVNFSSDKYPSCAQLSPNVSLHWAVQNGSITWGLDVDGVWDWVGLGISEGGMLGADFAVAAHDLTAHQWAAADYWSAGFAFPQLDKQQDVSLVFISRQVHDNVQGNTLVALRRPLVSCDPNGQDRAVLNDTRQTVVYAYGAGPFGYHGDINRGQADVVFLPNATMATPGSQNPPLQTLDLRMPSFAVPTAPTTYQCVNMALPADKKYHIYSYEPLIDDTPLVHHFVVYSCRGVAPPPTPLNQPYNCLDSMECEEFYMGWAPGVGKVDSPPVAALAFGAGTSIKYIVLQIHYTNLQGIAGQTDSSGFRLLYSSVLKQYDMGVLTLGSYEIAVPPGAPMWSTAPNVCPGGCTAQIATGTGAGAVAGGGGVTLVESFYHMHQLGKSMVTRHVRNGVELPPLGARDYFSFDYQSPIGIPPAARQLLPGDLLITTCTYTGAGRSNVTGFGLASYEEMCFNFLTYYPYNANISECVVRFSMAMDNLATCATNAVIDQLDQFMSDGGTDAAIQAAVQAGYLVPVPDNLTYSPYQPTCARSAPSSSGGGDAVSDDDVDSDNGSREQAEEQHHREERDVGGAVAAILLVTAVGGVAIFVVHRAMRKKRQLEEEQHLFEKYNPSSILLPIAGLIENNSSSVVPSGGGGGGGGDREDVYLKGLYGSGTGGGLAAAKGGGGAAAAGV